MDERERDEQDRGAATDAVPAIVEAQVESARDRVFRAYVRSREQARRLADAQRDAPDGAARRAS